MSDDKFVFLAGHYVNMETGDVVSVCPERGAFVTEDEHGRKMYLVKRRRHLWQQGVGYHEYGWSARVPTSTSAWWAIREGVDSSTGLMKLNFIYREYGEPPVRDIGGGFGGD
jgi:hypothetical protein